MYWCSNDATALADAEIEYADHSSPSIFVKFYLQPDSVKKLPKLAAAAGSKKVAVVIWTTTPWTLPANLGIALIPSSNTPAVDTGTDVIVVAEGLRERFLGATGLRRPGRRQAHRAAEFETPQGATTRS